MNSTPRFRFHDCNLTPEDDGYDFQAPILDGRAWGGCNEDCFSMFNNGSLLDGLILPESDISSSSSSSSSFLLSKSAIPEYYTDQLLGASDVPIFPSLLPDWSDNFSGLNGGSNHLNHFSIIHNFSGGNLLDEHGNFVQECNNNNELISKYDNPSCLDSNSSNWETKRNLTSPTEESNNVKVGRYSAEERKDRILRYLKKRNQRNFNKTIKYVCRKTLADRRVRVRGRFARNNEPCEETMIISREHQIKNNQSEGNMVLDDCDPNQIKEDNDWLQLQEAIDSLMYLPYISFSG